MTEKPTPDAAIEALAQVLDELDVPGARQRAREQLEDGVPHLARYLFLRQAWRLLLADGDTRWIEPTIASARAQPDAPFAGVGHALARVREAGARDEDVAEIARGMQAVALYALCRLVDEPTAPEPELATVRWALVHLTPDGGVAGPIPALHRSVLETDPTGREMRPRATDGSEG